MGGGNSLDKIEIVVRRTERDMISETVVASFEKEIFSETGTDPMKFPGLEIFLKQQTVYRNGVLIPLTKREFQTLVYLARHPGWLFQAEQIYEAVWQKDGGSCGSAVSTVISQLRRKLTPEAPKGGYIQTVMKSGYKFVIPT